MFCVHMAMGDSIKHSYDWPILQLFFTVASLAMTQLIEWDTLLVPLSEADTDDNKFFMPLVQAVY